MAGTFSERLVEARKRCRLTQNAVAELVKGHTEDKSKTWYERSCVPSRNCRLGLHLKLVVMVNKVANLRSMYVDYKRVGEELWERFNAPKAQQAWYYSKIQDGLLRCRDIRKRKRFIGRW